MKNKTNWMGVALLVFLVGLIWNYGLDWVVLSYLTESSIESDYALVPLEDLPGISADILSGDYLVVDDPVLSPNDDDLFVFKIQFPDKFQVELPELQLYGSPDVLNNLLTELRFIETNNSSTGVAEILTGAKQTVEDSIDGIVTAVKSPRESISGLWDAAKQSANYVSEAVKGEHNVISDASEKFDATLDSHTREVAQEHGISYENVYLEETKEQLRETAKLRMAGGIALEVATIAAPATKVAKPLQVTKFSKHVDTTPAQRGRSNIGVDSDLAKASNTSSDGNNSNPMLALPDASPNKPRPDWSGQRVDVFVDSLVSKNSGRVDPRRRIGMSNLSKNYHRLMVDIYFAKTYGNVSPSQFLDSVFAKANADTLIPELHHTPQLAKSRILANFDRAEEWGLFSKENLSRMRNGYSPLITKGDFGGERVELDHAIPKKLAPELQQSYANLDYIPQSTNRGKAARMTEESLSRKKQIEAELGFELGSNLPATAA